MGPVIPMLMPGSPEDLDAGSVLERMEGVLGVASLHHVHLWEMQEGEPAVDSHVVVQDGQSPGEVCERVKRWLGERVGVGHSTLEIETPDRRCDDAQAIGY